MRPGSVIVTDGNERSALAVTRSLGQRGLSVYIGAETPTSLSGASRYCTQPFVYPSGLVEVPMSPISDVGAFRSARWPLESFLLAIRHGVEWVIERRAVFDFLAHPSCLVVEDPEFRTIRLICELVGAASDRAEIVGLDRIAAAVKP